MISITMNIVTVITMLMLMITMTKIIHTRHDDNDNNDDQLVYAATTHRQERHRHGDQDGGHALPQ